MPLGKAKYDFRINVETKNGQQFSYISQSFFNSDVDTGMTVSASAAWHRITGSVSCSFQNDFIFTGDLDTDYVFKDNIYLSSSLNGGLESGSIRFINTKQQGNDFLRRFKVLGEKAATVLGIPHNLWIYTDEFRLVSGSQHHYFRGDVVADSLYVVSNMAISNVGKMTSDLPFKIDQESDRYIKFQLTSASVAPRNDLLMGYNDTLGQYWLSASSDVTFNIGGVNNLDVTNLNTTTTNTTVLEETVNISSSGDSHFGDATTDKHTFKGNVGILGGSGELSVSHSVDGLTVTGDISASGTIYAANFASQSGGSIEYTNITADSMSLGGANFEKHLTVYGDISASGDLYLEDDKKIHFQGGIGGGQYIQGGGNYITIDSDNDIALIADNVISLTTVLAGIGNHAWSTSDLPPKTLTVQGDISASGHVFVEGTVSASNFYLTSSVGAVVHHGATGLNLSKWEFTRNGTRKWMIANDGRADQDAAAGAQDSFLLKHGTADDGADHINISMKQDDQTVYFHGDISASGDLYAKGAHIFIGDPTSAYIEGSPLGISIYKTFASGDRAFHVNKEDGNVGIGDIAGESVPKKLTVVGDISASGDLYVDKDIFFPGVASPALGNRIHWASGSGASDISIYGLLGGMWLYSGSAVVHTLHDNYGAGNVGIHTINPPKALTVKGDISASGNTYFHNGTNILWGSGGTNQASLTQVATRFLFSSGSTVMMEISGSDGNSFVGIGGDVNPTKTLTVAGDISSSGDLYLEDGTYIGFTGGPDFGAGNDDEYAIRFNNDSVQIVAADNAYLHVEDGAVSINTTTPADGMQLTVQGDISASGAIYLQNFATRGVYFGGAGTDPRIIVPNAKGNILYFSTNSTSTPLVISSSNVGIKTVNPPKTLTVAGDISASGNTWFGSVGIGTTSIQKRLTVAGDISASGDLYVGGHNIYFADTDIYSINDYTALESGLSIFSGSFGFGKTQLAEFSGSSEGVFVGIGTPLSADGTSSPIPKTLTVQGDISASGDLYVRSGSFTKDVTIKHANSPKLRIEDTTNNYGIEFEQTNTSAVIRFNDGASQDLYFTSNADVDTMVLNGGTGNVGIKTSNPPKTLTVEGDISASADIYAGSGSANGVVLISPDGTKYRIKVANGGALSTESL